MTIRSYAELVALTSFEDRYRYLALRAGVGDETFGFERALNQQFYTSVQWKRVRNQVIVRDRGRDLAHPDHEMGGRIYIHHMNPMTPDDLRDGNPDILNPEFLISTTHRTHNAIHYGDASQLTTTFVERAPGDTVPWR